MQWRQCFGIYQRLPNTTATISHASSFTLNRHDVGVSPSYHSQVPQESSLSDAELTEPTKPQHECAECDEGHVMSRHGLWHKLADAPPAGCRTRGIQRSPGWSAAVPLQLLLPVQTGEEPTLALLVAAATLYSCWRSCCS